MSRLAGHPNPLVDFSAEQVHEASLELLLEVGFCVPDAGALQQLSRAGFLVDFETCMVRVAPGMFDTARKTLPSEVILHGRGGDPPLDLSPPSRFMGAGTPVNVLDLATGVRRPSTRSDVRDLIRLQDALDNIEIVRPTVTATDCGEGSDLAEIVELLLHTTKPIVHRTLSPDRVDAAFAMLACVAGGEQNFRDKPNFATLYCPISPGYFTPENVRCIMRWAAHGVPITLLSMAMGGASAPATLLGELVVINADVLAWVIALQLLFPGLPLIYGSVAAVLDMRTGLLPLGSPERGLVNMGAAHMAHFYGMPAMCGGLSSDAKQLDAQAGYEKAITAIPLMLEEAEIIYGAGAVDAGAAISFLQLVLDNELIGGLRRLAGGVPAHDLGEELDLIKARTPRGNFLNAVHTRRAHHEHWLPGILSRESYETWSQGNETIESRCRERAHDILHSHASPALSANTEAELEHILRQSWDPDFRLESRVEEGST